MMKKRILFVALALFVAGNLFAQTETPSTAKESGNEQNEKKEKKEKEKKEKSKFGAFLGRLGETATGINMTDEPFIVNPLKSYIDIVLVGAYGDPTNGEITLVIKVKNKGYELRAEFGGYNSFTAYDKNGKSYKSGSGISKSVTLPKDIWVEVKMDGYHKLYPVEENIPALELINMKVKLYQKESATVELRNIPILWGSMPE